MEKRRDKKSATSPRGAVSYPKSVRLVYQAVRNLQRHHFMACASVPEEVRLRYLELKSGRLQGKRVVTRTEYWESCCRRMGMIDTDAGIRLRNGRFADDDDDIDECGGADVLDGGGAEMSAAECKKGDSVEATCNAAALSNVDRRKRNARDSAADMSTAVTDRMTSSPLPSNELDSDAMASGVHISGATLRNIELDERPGINENASQRQGGFIDVMTGEGKIPGVLHASMPQLLSTESIPLASEAECPQHVSTPQLQSQGSILPASEPQCNPLRPWLNHGEQPAVNGASRKISTSLAEESVEDAKSVGNDKLTQTATLEQSNSLLMHGLSALSTPAASPEATVSREAVLKLVKLAHSTVQVIGEMRQFPIGDDAVCDGVLGDADGQEGPLGNLRLLGEELFELFSGQKWVGLASVEAVGDSDLSGAATQLQQLKKKGKRPQEDGGKSFVLLSQLGLPTALCSLVSSLLDEGRSESDKCQYTSISEVEKDLLLMVTYPERYLFDSNTSGLELQKLNLSHSTLYGRDTEISKLLEAYDRMVASTDTNRNEVVLISGYSGTGKSSLVRKVECQYVEKGACFISGKFDAMQQMQPLSAIVNALNEYCDLLAQDTTRIKQVCEAVSTAVGSEGRALLDLIPNLRKILPYASNECPFSPRAIPPEAQHRLAFLVRKLFRVTCSKAKPVVLFLDDLQWADEASLELMRSIVSDRDLDSLMFIGCYRDNEVGPDHPLMAQLVEIQRSGRADITTLCVNNLDANSVNALVSEALHQLPRKTRSLADVVREKTGGNALFVVQFLASLCDEGQLRYSLASRCWEWEIDSIRSHSIADSVVDLMKGKLLLLAPEVIEALKVAAALGAQSHEDLLRILDKDPAFLGITTAALNVAVSEGLMAKVGSPVYRFSHDQIQSTAYQLIAESEREAFHLRIGRSLRWHSSQEERDNYLFVMVDQLHRGSGMITDHNEKIDLAHLSMMAGQKAAAMSTFSPALAFFKAGIGMISDYVDWESHRELCFGLYNSCAEMEFILGYFEEMKEHLEHVLGRARTLEEKLRAYLTLVQSLAAQMLTDDAINAATEVLAQLGVAFPSVLSNSAVKQEIMTTQMLLSTKSEETLRCLETMPNGNMREAMKFLNLLTCWTYLGKKEYMAMVTCRMVQLSLLHGVCRESAYGFGVYGLIICGQLGDYGGGYRLGKLALALLERFKANEIHARVACAVFGFISNWTEPIQSALPPLKDAINIGLSTGDTEFAMVAAQNYHSISLASGAILGPLMDEMRVYSKQMVELNQTLIYTMNKPLRQATLNLLGRSPDPTRLVGEEMDEDTLLNNLDEGDQGTLTSLIFWYRMWLEYLFGEYERAVETAKKNRDVAKQNMSRFSVVCNHVFYSGLNALTLARKDSQGQWEGTISETMRQMEVWASSSQWNCQHKLELMRAEYLYLKGDAVGAAKGYDLAVDLAASHRFVHEEALALERAGIFYMENGDHDTASKFFFKACCCYDRWGACSKVAHVRESYL